MKITLHTSYATALRTYQAGDVLTVPDTDAIRLIERKLASPVRDSAAECTVASPAPEAAVIRTAQPHNNQSRRREVAGRRSK